jgi:hypothetical protein
MTTMTVSITVIAPVSRPDFAGDVSGIDLTRVVTLADVAAIEAGMAPFARRPGGAPPWR